MKKFHERVIILAVSASIVIITALALHAYVVSIAQIHRIKSGDVIINGITFEGGSVEDHTIAIGISGIGGKSIIYVKIEELPYSFGSSVTIYDYGSDWLELSIKRG
jgi:hypothetical protein